MTKFKVSVRDGVSVDDPTLDQKNGLDGHLRCLADLQFHDLKKQGMDTIRMSEFVIACHHKKYRSWKNIFMILFTYNIQ